MIPLPRRFVRKEGTNADEPESIGLCLTVDDARVLLEHWQRGKVKLGFSYFRAGGGLILSGCAVVARVRARSVTLDMGTSRLAVAVGKVCIEYAPIEFFRPGSTGSIDIEGLSFSLENQDWLFVFPDSSGRYSNRVFPFQL